MKIDGFLQEVYVVNLLLLVKLKGNEVTPHKKKLLNFLKVKFLNFSIMSTNMITMAMDH